MCLVAPPNTICLRTLVEHTGRVFRLQFDEFQIVSSSHDDTILIWDFLNYKSNPPGPGPAPSGTGATAGSSQPSGDQLPFVFPPAGGHPADGEAGWGAGFQAGVVVGGGAGPLGGPLPLAAQAPMGPDGPAGAPGDDYEADEDAEADPDADQDEPPAANGAQP